MTFFSLSLVFDTQRTHFVSTCCGSKLILFSLFRFSSSFESEKCVCVCVSWVSARRITITHHTILQKYDKPKVVNRCAAATATDRQMVNINRWFRLKTVIEIVFHSITLRLFVTFERDRVWLCLERCDGCVAMVSERWERCECRMAVWNPHKNCFDKHWDWCVCVAILPLTWSSYRMD